MRKCNNCLLEKEDEFFGKRSDTKDGYRKECKECYRNKNLNRYKEYGHLNKSKYYQDNKSDIKIKNEKYYEDNKEDILISVKKYYQDNKDRLNTISNSKKKIKYNSCDIFKLKENIRSQIRFTLTRNRYTKRSRLYKILGCDSDEFVLYLESKFEPWMTWDNRGLYNGELNYGWDIDHIIPISSANTIEDVIRLNHYTNLRPLCSKTNRDIIKNGNK